MNFLKENWFKLAILVIVVGMSLGVLNYLNTRNTLVKQEQDARVLQDTQNKIAKAESDKKEYIANRKKDCLAIYETEGKKFNNVTSWSYDESTDSCKVVYAVKDKKTIVQCAADFAEAKKLLPEGKPVPSFITTDYAHCVDGTFENTF